MKKYSSKQQTGGHGGCMLLLLIAIVIVLVTLESCSKLTCPGNSNPGKSIYEPHYRTKKMTV